MTCIFIICSMYEVYVCFLLFSCFQILKATICLLYIVMLSLLSIIQPYILTVNAVHHPWIMTSPLNHPDSTLCFLSHIFGDLHQDNIPMTKHAPNATPIIPLPVVSVSYRPQAGSEPKALWHMRLLLDVWRDGWTNTQNVPYAERRRIVKIPVFWAQQYRKRRTSKLGGSPKAAEKNAGLCNAPRNTLRLSSVALQHQLRIQPFQAWSVPKILHVQQKYDVSGAPSAAPRAESRETASPQPVSISRRSTSPRQSTHDHGMIGNGGMTFCLDFVKYPALYVLWYDPTQIYFELLGNSVSRRQLHLGLERSFFILFVDRVLAAKRRQICETEESSLDFRPCTNPWDRRIIFSNVSFKSDQALSTSSRTCIGAEWRSSTFEAFSGKVQNNAQDCRRQKNPTCKLPPSWSISVHSDLGPSTFYVQICWWTTVLVLGAAQPPESRLGLRLWELWSKCRIQHEAKEVSAWIWWAVSPFSLWCYL